MSAVVHVVYEVRVPGSPTVEVRRWAEVLGIARDSDWAATATQYAFDEEGYEVMAIAIDSHQIADDYMERAR